MRRFLATLIPAFLLIASPALAAGEWAMTSFASEIEVRTDGTLLVEERIGADFLTPRHGIYRYVPYEGKDADGRSYRLRVKLLAATMDGAPVDVGASKVDGNVAWRLGWPDRTFTGVHEYVLTYEVGGAIGRFDDHDELYWNVAGDGWDAPLPVVTAKVLPPPGAPPDAVRSACYAGPYGSTGRDCVAMDAGTALGFATKRTGDPLTVVVGWPKGLVGEDRLGAFLDFVSRWWPLALPAVVGVLMYRRWRRHGDDPEHATTVVQYEPPAGLAPAEIVSLRSQNADKKTLAATIVDLAARGYLSIEETTTDGILGTGLGKSKDYVFTGTKPRESWQELKPFERDLLANLLHGDDPPRRRMSELRNVFHAHAEAYARGVMDGLTAAGHFEKNPAAVRSGYVAGAVGLAVIGWIAFGFMPILSIALFASAALIGGFGWFMPRWSAKGHAAAGHADGYREFISKVEKHRAPWMETQDMFEKSLPYALAFGLGAKWTNAFAGLLTRPPSWYRGASMAAWNPALFASDLERWSDTFNAIAVSTPSSKGSGSGFGGGGFSGGGFGGGGGGSW